MIISPRALGFMPWTSAPLRARRVDASVPVRITGDLCHLRGSASSRYGSTGRGGTGVETISELVVWP